MENWLYATAASTGTVARRYPFNYQQSMGAYVTDHQLGGDVSTQVTEQIARGFYRRWASYMKGGDWNELLGYDRGQPAGRRVSVPSKSRPRQRRHLRDRPRDHARPGATRPLGRGVRAGSAAGLQHRAACDPRAARGTGATRPCRGTDGSGCFAFGRRRQGGRARAGALRPHRRPRQQCRDRSARHGARYRRSDVRPHHGRQSQGAVSDAAAPWSRT